MNTTTTITSPARPNARVAPGTTVVSRLDGQAATVARVATYRRSGTDAWSYLVRLPDGGGHEVWEVGDLFVPDDQGPGDPAANN